VAKPVRKDLDVKLAYTADVLPNKRFFTVVLIPTLYIMFEERFPRTVTPIEDDSAPPRREAHAQ